MVGNFSSEYELRAYIYNTCPLDQTKAYEIQSDIWSGRDTAYPLIFHFNTQNAQQTASPIHDLVKDYRILTKTASIPVDELMAGKTIDAIVK